MNDDYINRKMATYFALKMSRATLDAEIKRLELEIVKALTPDTPMPEIKNV